MADIPKEVIERLRRARRVAVSTGAGVSAESGVPTFRGENGIWKKMNPEELASVNGFMSNPDLVWEWYQHRRTIMSEVQPNPGHLAIAAFQKLFDEFTLITQNVDGLHARAGSKDIIELHGNITRNKCFTCNAPYDDEIDLDAELPHCSCGGMIRPDVVWFGEMLPEQAIRGAMRAAETAEVFFSVGTSALVQPAASLPYIARQNGSFIIEVNLEPTPLTSFADVFLQGKSGEVLPVIVEQLSQK
ncbi:MAG: NAD-dependent deacylase [Candidatus Zixiibacteriota bacterium]